MLLPLFRSPVSGLGRTDADSAYDYGRRSLDQSSGEAVPARGFLDNLFKPILRCVAEGGRIDLDIAGYASQDWSQPLDHDPAQLNLFLAEGRRAAVLDRLWQGIDPARIEMATRIGIVSASGEVVPLDRTMEEERPVFRFLNTDGIPEPTLMRDHLSGFVDDPEGQLLGDRLRELLDRSALIHVVAVEGPGCASPRPRDDIAPPTGGPALEARLSDG